MLICSFYHELFDLQFSFIWLYSWVLRCTHLLISIAFSELPEVCRFIRYFSILLMQCWEFWVFVCFAERTENPSQCSQCTTKGLSNINLWRTFDWINHLSFWLEAVLWYIVNVSIFSDITLMRLLFSLSMPLGRLKLLPKQGGKMPSPFPQIWLAGVLT